MRRMTQPSPPYREYCATSFEDAAVLRVCGLHAIDTRANGGRVSVVFEDTDASAADLLARHARGDLEVKSSDLLDSYQWAKSTVFNARRRLGLERGR